MGGAGRGRAYYHAGVVGPERQLVVTTRARGGGRLDGPALPELPDPPPDLLADGARGAGRLVLRGGEPTLRPDLPALIAAIAAIAPPLLRTDGWALTTPGALGPLADVGLAGLRISLHSGRTDAHDWLAGRAGATRAAVRAIRAASEVGLRVELEVAVTRPTALHLAETVALAERLGASRVLIRRPSVGAIAADDVVAVTARLDLLAPQLEAAATGSDRIGLEGFPRCSTGSAHDLLRPADATELVVVDSPGWSAVQRLLRPPVAAARCDDCPGSPRCPGLCQGYVDVFGSSELGRGPAA